MSNEKVFLEVFKNRVQSIVEEMANVVLRTGFTAFVKETGDFGTYLVSVNGETFGSPLETGYNLSLGLPVKDVIDSIDQWNEGDVVICNDPYLTGGLSTHLPDVYLLKPIFIEQELLAFCLCFVHSSDVGGKVPGSVSPSSYDIHQEGLRLPPTKLYEKGILNEQLLDLFLINCRIPSQNKGDINALLAACYRGEMRMKELVSRYGKEQVLFGIEGILSYAEQRVRAIIREIPDGCYDFWDYLDPDQSNFPIRIRCRMIVENDGIFLDFEGTDSQSRKSINIASLNKQGHYMIVPALIRYFRTLDSEIPWNSGMVRMIRNEAPSGSILNCEFPASVGSRAATFIRIMDVITGALSTAQPDKLPAAGAGQACIVMLSAINPSNGQRQVGVIQPICGGSGGRPMKDGVDGMDFAVGHLRNVPVEVVESDMPIIIERYGLRPDSSGAGLYRGGEGIEVSFKNLSPDTILTARNMERMFFQPWGRLGGKPGAEGLVLNRNPEGEHSVKSIDELLLQPGDTVSFFSQGGGGYGNPLERPIDAIITDIENGLLSVEKAHKDYAVRLKDGEYVRQMQESEVIEPFSYGVYRENYERIWNDTLQLEINKVMQKVPTNLRNYYLQKIRENILEQPYFESKDSEIVVQAIYEKINATILSYAN